MEYTNKVRGISQRKLPWLSAVRGDGHCQHGSKAPNKTLDRDDVRGENVPWSARQSQDKEGECQFRSHQGEYEEDVASVDGLYCQRQ